MAVLLLLMASLMAEGLGCCSLRMTHHLKHVRCWQGRLARVTELPIDGEQHTTIRLSGWPESSPVCTLLVSLTMLQLPRDEPSTCRAGMSETASPSCSFLKQAAMSRYLKGLHGLTSRQPDGLLPNILQLPEAGWGWRRPPGGLAGYLLSLLQVRKGGALGSGVPGAAARWDSKPCTSRLLLC